MNLPVLTIAFLFNSWYEWSHGVIVREKTTEEIKLQERIRKAKRRCNDHPKMCDYYYSRGWYNECTVGGAKWYYCPRTCGYCALLEAGAPIPTPAPGCQDLERFCPTMAKYGECDSEEIFMKMFCRKSCKLCLKAPPCFDKDELCPDFAKDGMCYLEPSYMLTFCPKTCGFCFKPTFPPKNICEDKDKQKCAASVAKADKCVYGGKKEREWLSENCRKTCKMCTKTGDCFDENSLCPFYGKTHDWCTNTTSRYYSFMQLKCKYSCKICKE